MITAEDLIEKVSECSSSLFSMQREGICKRLRNYVSEDVLFKVRFRVPLTERELSSSVARLEMQGRKDISNELSTYHETNLEILSCEKKAIKYNLIA